MSPLRHIPAQLQHWIVPYVLVVLTLLAIATPVAYFEQTQAYQRTLRASAVDGCQRQNQVRAALRLEIQQQIARSRGLSPSSFPGFSPKAFEELLHQQLSQDREVVATIPNVDCEAAYPQP